MDYEDHRHVSTSSSNGIWFNTHTVKGYVPPPTLHKNQLIGLTPISQKQNRASSTISKEKGFQFEKAIKVPPFTVVNKTPSSSDYFAGIKLKEISKLNHFERTTRFVSDKKDGVGVGDYNIDSNEVKRSSKKKNTLDKAQRNTYFDQAKYQASEVPGPGHYNAPKVKKSQSVSIFNSLTHSKSADKSSNTRKQNRIPTDLGPWSYQVKRSSSVTCSALMKIPYRETDVNIRKKVTEMRKQKINSQQTGPGKYLRIEHWANYDKKKQQHSNGLTVCSKPASRIYN